MGYGFPAAIGAQLGKPDAIVFDIAGDGSIQMNIQELATAVINKLPVKVAIFNNCYLGMVRQWQELFYRKRYSYTCLGGTSPDFVKLAEAHGLEGLRVRQRSEIEGAVAHARAAAGTVVIDFRVEQEDSVYPMVAAGSPLGEMIRRPAQGRKHNPIYETGEDEE